MATIIDELIAILGYDIRGEDELKRFNRGLDQLEKKAVAVGRVLGTAAAAAGAAVAAGFAFLGTSVIDTSAKFETYRATLETIEGSADKAKTALDWITQFAKTTPYEVDELTAAFVKLRSYGLDPMDGSMIVLGDTAAGMGKSIDQVVEAMADASTFQFERLRELGIVAAQAGDKVTFSWTENGKAMSKTIKKTSTEVTKFLTDVWGKKFGGAMIRQSTTWTGMMSNLGDSWTEFQRRIGDAGFFDVVKNKLGDLMDQIGKWQSDGTIDAIAKTMSATFSTVADAIGTFADRIATHIGFIVDHWEELKGPIKAVGIALGILVAWAFPVVTAFGIIALAIDDLMTYFEGGESVIGNFIKWLQDIIPGTGPVEDAILNLGVAVAGGLLAAFVIAPGTMAGIILRSVGAIVLALAPALIAGLTALSTSVGAGFAAAFALLATPVGWAIILAGVAAALIAFFWDDLIALWNAVDWSQLGKTIGQGILDGLNSMSAAIAGWFNGILPPWARAFVEGGGLEGQLQRDGIRPGPQNPGSQAGAMIGGMAQPSPSNLSRMQAEQAGASVVNDNTQNTQNVNVQAPVTVHVRQSTDAPAAVGNAIGNAVTQGAQPSRMQTGGSF